MNNTERLTELLNETLATAQDNTNVEQLAESLDRLGVIAIPAKVGDTVYVINRRMKRVFECVVINVNVGHANWRHDNIKTRWVGTQGNESIRKWGFYQIGNYVFFDRASAEAALLYASDEEGKRDEE